MQYMIQNTSGKIWFGPIVKSTDGYNPLTGVGTAAATAAVDFVYGTSSTGGMTTAHSWEEIGRGLYLMGLASDAISVLGGLRVNFVDSSGIPTYEDVRILSANQYNSLVSTSDYLLVDMQQLGGSSGEISTGMLDVNVQLMAGETITTDAADNFDNYFYNNDVVSTERISQILTTADIVEANVVAVASNAITSDAGDNWENYWFNNDVVSTERVSDTITATPSTVTPLNVGAISSVALTTQAAANWQLFYNDGGAVTTEVVSDLPTTADLVTTASDMNIGAVAGTTVVSATAFKNTTSDSINANVTLIAGETVTTDAADNFDNFFFNNGAVSTERVGDLPTTGDLWTTSKYANVGSLRNQIISTQAGANFNAFLDAAGATVTKIVNDVTTMTSANLSTFTTALPVDVGRIAGATVATGSAQIGVNAVAIASEAITSQAADNWNAFFDHGGATVTKEINDITTMTSANLSTFTTALEVDIGQVKGAAITDINDFICSGYTIGTGDRPYGDFLTALNAFVLPNASWDGTTVAYHTSDGGTTVFTVAIATDDAVYTTY